LGQPIHLIGVEFNRESRNVVGFEVGAAWPRITVAQEGDNQDDGLGGWQLTVCVSRVDAQ